MGDRLNRTAESNEGSRVIAGRLRVSQTFWSQVIRYALVSALALVVDFGLLVFLKQVAGLPVLLANTISFVAGLVVTFIFSRTWVFHQRKISSPALEFGLFALVGVTGLALNDLIVWAGVALSLDYRLAKVAAAGIGFCWNFLLRKFLIYR